MRFPSIVFFGTPVFAAQILSYLIDHKVPIVGVVSQPDRPKGRSLQIEPVPVKEIASERLLNIPLFQPEKSSTPEFLDQLAALRADLYVVVAFGQILSQKLLQIPPLGCINVHPSLLPKYRGAAPIQRPLLNGDQETGVAIQKMVRELDAGDVLRIEKIALSEEITYGELEQTLCDISKPLLLSVLEEYGRGVPPAAPQDVSQVTFAPKISVEEALIHWEKEARDLHNQIRAFNPRPGAWCWIEWNGERKRLKIFRAKVVDGMPGEATSSSLDCSVSAQGTNRARCVNKELMICCGRGALQLLEVQMEGKPRCLASEWLRGARSLPKF